MEATLCAPALSVGSSLRGPFDNTGKSPHFLLITCKSLGCCYVLMIADLTLDNFLMISVKKRLPLTLTIGVTISTII